MKSLNVFTTIFISVIFFGSCGTQGDQSSSSASDPNECAYNIECFDDYKTGMSYAQKTDKPVLLYFTAYKSINSREMEEKVWPDSQVLDLLKNEVVLISLYTDDHQKLSEQYTSDITGGNVETVGEKLSELQNNKFGTTVTPYYRFVDHSGEPLGKAKGYETDSDVYKDWLQKGITLFKQQK